MKKKMATFIGKILFLILTYFQATHFIYAKITPPNYDFTLATIEPFFPTKSLEAAQKLAPKIEVLEDLGELKLIKFKFTKKEYSLDIYAQVKKDIIIDTYIRMPQYFNHDLFLKELQTKWKKQDKFKRKDGSSYYTWLNRDQMNILYQGSCSITCFPMFIEFSPVDKSIKSLFQKFNEALLR